MADRYNYDAKGNYTGKSSDTPPPGSSIGGVIALIFIVVVGLNMCSSDKSSTSSSKAPITDSNNKAPAFESSDPNNKVPDPELPSLGDSATRAPESHSSNKDPTPKWSVPDENAMGNTSAPAQQPQQVDNSVTQQNEPPKQWVIPKED